MPEVSAEVFSFGEQPTYLLFDREDDLAAIDAALAEAVGGAGGVLLIEGPAGIGKTTLLDHLRRRASALKMTVQTARGGELERGFGFGIVRQLLEAVLVDADATERDRLLAGAARLAEPVFTDVSAAEETGDVAFATLHGLYWLVANLDRAWPAGTIDRRRALGRRAVATVLTPPRAPSRGNACRAWRWPCERAPTRHRQDLGSLMLEARPPILRPRPLGKSAVASLVRASLGDEASAQLCRACAEATGGNPFLLSELLGEFRRDGRPASEIDPKAVDRLAPERIAAAVLLRVSRLDPEAPALARSVAVLGEQARLSLCARLAGVNPRKARTLAAGLVDLAVLDAGEPLRFVHPVVRTAIYEDLSAAEQADLHARAAGLLADQRADPGAIAVHLLATAPSGDRDVVTMLREAARSALVGGAPDTAAALLRRALDEPPAAADRPSVLVRARKRRTRNR